MLSQRGVRGGDDLGLEEGGLGRANPGRATRSHPGGEIAGGLLLRPPAGDGADTDAKDTGRLSLTVTGVNASQQPLAEDGRVLLHPSTLPA